MSSAKAILIGAMLIAASVVFVNTIRPAEAQYTGSGQFQIMHNSNVNANSSVFRINTATGEVSYCFVPGGTPTTVVQCTKSVQ